MRKLERDTLIKRSAPEPHGRVLNMALTTLGARKLQQCKFRKLLLAALVAFAAPAFAQPKLIAIANFGEHPALRAAVDGFKAELRRAGLVEGKLLFD